MSFLPSRDDTPHVPNEDLGERAVLDIIGNLTEIIMQVFPGKCEFTKGHHRLTLFSINFYQRLLFSTDTKVYSALGNHDYHPKNQLPAGQSFLYEEIAKLWQKWLNSGSTTTFKKGGFLSLSLDLSLPLSGNKCKNRKKCVVVCWLAQEDITQKNW